MCAPRTCVYLDDLVPADAIDVESVGQMAWLSARPGREAEVERALVRRHDHFQCWRKAEMPADWHFGRNPRIPPIVCQADDGWRVWLHRWPAATTLKGEHGFAPEDVGMRAVFTAVGPSFRAGVRLPAFDNVDVYPLLARLLRITPAANDGDIAPLLPALQGRSLMLCRRIDSPVGPLMLAADEHGLRHIEFRENRHPADTGDWHGGDSDVLRAAEAQLGEYFAGTRTTFDLPLAPRGTDFQVSVWRELARIPFGTTISYAQLAHAHGQRQCDARGRRREWAQPVADRAALPSGDRRGRRAGRLRRRPAGEGIPVAPGRRVAGNGRPVRDVIAGPAASHGAGGNSANILSTAACRAASTCLGVAGTVPSAVARQTAFLVLVSNMSSTRVPTV